MPCHFYIFKFFLMRLQRKGMKLYLKAKHMRRLFWLLLILGGYVWVVTTGREAGLLRKGKALYRYVQEWLADAESDFQLEAPVEKWNESQEEAAKKKQRRWD
jgi:hypothetical protein